MYNIGINFNKMYDKAWLIIDSDNNLSHEDWLKSDKDYIDYILQSNNINASLIYTSYENFSQSYDIVIYGLDNATDSEKAVSIIKKYYNNYASFHNVII